MSPWEKLLERPHSRGNVVQFYEPADELSLTANVSRYLFESVVGAAIGRLWSRKPVAGMRAYGEHTHMIPALSDRNLEVEDILARARRHCLQ